MRNQIKTKVDVSRTRLENLVVNVVKDIMDRAELYSNIPVLESEESPDQGEGLKILIPSQMLSRLSISLAQLKAEHKFIKNLK